jgi:hypothetical protein
MRNKDALLLENCYNKVQGQLLKEGIEDIEFIKDISLDYLLSEEKDREVVRDLDVYKDVLKLRYRVEMETRTWGIKSIMPLAMKLEPFALSKMDDDFKEIPVKQFETIDLSDAQIDISDGDGFSPTSIVLFLDSNLEIVPEKCTVSFN